jgi:RNA polymerase sigma-70 factor (ECF subfamily)
MFRAERVVNPKQNQQEALMKINLARSSKKYDREAFFRMRLSLIKAIDPLTTAGNELQDLLLQCNHRAMEDRCLGADELE